MLFLSDLELRVFPMPGLHAFGLIKLSYRPIATAGPLLKRGCRRENGSLLGSLAIFPSSFFALRHALRCSHFLQTLFLAENRAAVRATGIQPSGASDLLQKTNFMSMPTSRVVWVCLPICFEQSWFCVDDTFFASPAYSAIIPDIMAQKPFGNRFFPLSYPQTNAFVQS